MTTDSETTEQYLTFVWSRFLISVLVFVSRDYELGIASHFAPQNQVNAMQQHLRIAQIAMQTNARIITLSSTNLPFAFGSDQRLDYCG